MGTNWFVNFTQLPGVDFGEEKMKEIPNPKTELAIHVTFKCVQLGTAIGTFIPALTIFRPPKKVVRLWVRTLRNGGCIGAAAGLVAGPLMTLARIQTLKEEEIIDRCYRLRHNIRQLHTDRMTLLGSLVGLTFGRLGGFVFGLNFTLGLSYLRNWLISRPGFPKVLRVQNYSEMPTGPVRND